MTEAHPPVESATQQRNIAQEQYIGIKRLYSDIFSMTSMEQRREIARHYEWINPQNPLNAVCRRRVDYTGNIAPNSPNSVAYNLADEYRLSEAGLVRDTLIQDQQFARFNRTVRMVNSGQLSPDHINMADLTNVIDILLKYDVLGTQEFRDELLNRNKRPIILTNGAGERIQDAGSTFFEMIDELQTSMGILNRNANTQALINQAIDILSFRVNSKVAQLGVEQGIERLSDIAASNEGLKALRGIVDGMIARMPVVKKIEDPQSEIPTQPIPVPLVVKIEQIPTPARRIKTIDGHPTYVIDEDIPGLPILKEKTRTIIDVEYKGSKGNVKIVIRPHGQCVIYYFPESGGQYEWLPFDSKVTAGIIMKEFGIDMNKMRY